MRIDRRSARANIEGADFKRLFLEDLGWDRASEAHPVTLANGVTVSAAAVAEKRSFKAFVVQAPAAIGMLDAAQRRTVRDRITPLARENMIVFLSADRKSQIWQWTRRDIGRPLALREHHFTVGQPGESLLQRLDHLVVDLDEEPELTIKDVADRARLAFDAERTSRRFYDRFKSEHNAFLARISGIASDDERGWYASVMLNRLMFVYFIQQKGFLDGDRDYLRTRLRQVQAQDGPDQFHRFYRSFLLRLFFDGLSKRESDRPADVDALIGRVPYLNGGLFVPHELEQRHQIEIPDAAFEAILDFFAEFAWHLDDRPVQKDNEINPDVLGYIFERYINQKQMGAYYTKEDVTEYIARVTVIPRLLDMVAKQVPNAFEGDGSIWQHLHTAPDRYVFPSMRVGGNCPVPDGMTMTSPEAAAEVGQGALPRETWRGFIDRRERSDATLARLAAGEIRSTDDLVTLNLDVRQFAQDVIERADDPAVIDGFYRALKSMSVLDPTCGSGAFLFAVLNILEPIYEATLDRMRAFLDEAGRTGWTWNQALRERFEHACREADSHASRKYFIFRSIVVDNLFGVDLMQEATEVCKLRLFLKLASQIDDQSQIEPLPDIDFNIRPGNALVGYVQSPRGAVRGLDLAGTGDPLTTQAAELDGLFARYRAIQFGDRTEALATKQEIVDRIGILDATLNRTLGERYSARTETAVARWSSSHHPFHWWAGFYDRMERGGFDVIVGNPPYIATSKVRKDYTVLDLETERSADIYAWVMERSTALLAPSGRSGMIVPLSLTFSSRFTALRELLFENYASNWFSSFGRIPSALFAYDVRVRNTIHVGRKMDDPRERRSNHSGRLHRWFEQERDFLFETLGFIDFDPSRWGGLVPKVHTPELVKLFESARGNGTPTIEQVLRSSATKHMLWFKKSAYNWLNFCLAMPPCYDRSGALIPHNEFGAVYFSSAEERNLAFLLLNGKWQFANWYITGDDFHVTIGMFENLPAPFHRLTGDQRAELSGLAVDLDRAMQDAVSFKKNAGKRVGNYNLARCRHVTDRSDAIFTEAFGWQDAWPDVQLLYSQAVKTTYESEDDDLEGAV